jgi:HD superfamily phosphohydrolase
MKDARGRVSVAFDHGAIRIRDAIFGNHRIEDPVLVALLTSPAVTRLRGVHQAGGSYLVREGRDLSRFDHSVGVMLGIRRAGGSLEEQVAGLLHDVSHTAFSHVIDHVIDNTNEDFHEQRKRQWIARTEVPGVLSAFELDVASLLDNELWPLLDRPLPELCMDRIDYTLRDLLHCERINEPEAATFVDSMQTHGGRVIVNGLAQALWFVQRYHEEVTDLFMDPVECYANASMGQAIRIALQQGVLTDEDLFEEDEQLLRRLRSVGLPNVTETLGRLQPPLLVSESPEPTEAAVHVRHKYRVVDPVVRVRPGVMARCSELDASVGELHDQVRERARRGSWLTYAGRGLLSQGSPELLA